MSDAAVFLAAIEAELPRLGIPPEEHFNIGFEHPPSPELLSAILAQLRAMPAGLGCDAVTARLASPVA